MKRLLILGLLALAACKEEAALLPDPVPLTAEAVGHYCQMDLLEHPGPKAQVHLDGTAHPLFFSQVRDALAYRIMPEQSHAIAAIYVNDMGAAPSWEDTGADNWINAETAFFVVGSTREGGMGAAEMVPFASHVAAQGFADRYGGTLLALTDIPPTLILAPEGPEAAPSGDDDDFLRRLDALRDSTGG
jgi:copper chaperone NosL